MPRYECQPFQPEHVHAAAVMLAQRHARQRLLMPALDRRYEDAAPCAALLTALVEQESSSGAVALENGRLVAYVLGVRRDDATWGPNVWVEDAGSAGSDAEALRAVYAAAAARWVAQGWTSHYAVVPANDRQAVDAWFSLSFGLQHVHALREPAGADYAPMVPEQLTLRPKQREDLPVLAELNLILPRHVNGSPVFSRTPVPTFDESLAEATADFDDERFAEFVAEYEGRVVGSSLGCSLELSSGNTRMMRPVSAGLLAHVAVLPDARGLGAGRALAQRILTWARDEGYEWIATDWRSTNLEASRSWRALGFEPSFLRLHRLIG